MRRETRKGKGNYFFSLLSLRAFTHVARQRAITPVLQGVTAFTSARTVPYHHKQKLTEALKDATLL